MKVQQGFDACQDSSWLLLDASKSVRQLQEEVCPSISAMLHYGCWVYSKCRLAMWQTDPSLCENSATCMTTEPVQPAPKTFTRLALLDIDLMMPLAGTTRCCWHHSAMQVWCYSAQALAGPVSTSSQHRQHTHLTSYSANCLAVPSLTKQDWS